MKSSHLCLGLAICALFNSIAYAKPVKFYTNYECRRFKGWAKYS